MRLGLFTLFLCSLSAFAATQYVDTTNSAASDSYTVIQAQNPATPWKTITHAAASVSAGDNVIVKPGTYNESTAVVVPSGTAGNPVTFEGVRGADGSWLTTVDLSTHFTNGWVAASEIGPYIWKQSSVAFQPGEVHVNGQRIAYVFTMGDLSSIGYNSVYSDGQSAGLTNGTNYLNLATNVILHTGELTPTLPVYSWDGVEAMWGSVSNSGAGTWTLYFRYRDGHSPNGQDTAVIKFGGVALTLGSYDVISNLFFPNFNVAISIYGGVGNSVSSNLFVGGYTQVLVQGGGSGNAIRNNIANGNYFGWTNNGAWGSGTDYVSRVRSTTYAISKFPMGQTTSRYEGFELFQAGNSNVITGNVTTNGLGTAIELNGTGVTTYSTNSLVANNYIGNLPSVGITSGPGFVGLDIVSNTFVDCNSQLRCHNLNYPLPGDSNRLVYVHRNQFWLPTGVGDHIFTHTANYPNVTNLYSTYWIYNNSFSGGYGVINDNSGAQLNGGLPFFYYVNNVLSSKYYVGPNSWGDYMWTNAFVFGAFDYNEVAPLTPNLITANPKAAWWGSHNVTNSVAQWNNVQGMSFQLPVGSPAIDAAIDTTASFTLGEPQGTNTFSALPQGGDVKVGPAWDMGALEFSGHAIASSLKVINLFLGNPTFH